MINNNCQWRVQEQGKVALCLKTMLACRNCKCIVEINTTLINCYIASYGLNGNSCHNCCCCKGKEPEVMKRLHNRLIFFDGLLRSYKRAKFTGDPLKIVADRQENNERTTFIKLRINSIRTSINYQKRKEKVC